MPASDAIAHVGLPVALAGPLQYRVPPELVDALAPGHRVRVPLRGKETFGTVLRIAYEPPPSGVNLRPVLAIDPPEVLLPGTLLHLVTWLAHYYAAPIGIALETAVPRAVARPPRSPRATPGKDDAQETAGPAPSGLSAASRGPRRHAPNAAQAAALARIRRAMAARHTTRFLLQGVTGSGKTEVYLQAIEEALAAEQGALLLVPEIALGTQVVRRVRERFGDQAVEIHSQLGVAERRRAWWAARRGQARVVVGARSAVFVPIENLGLIVVDEEHEPAYKQTETPRYQGRDTALMRGRLEGAVVILGSATPSLESRHNCETGKYVRLELPERITRRPPAPVTLVDMRATPEEAAGGQPPAGRPQVRGGPPGPRIVTAGPRDPAEPFSDYLLERLRAALERREQAILFLNRRGFSTAVQCRDCGHVFECQRCSVVLTYHRQEKRLRCHYCNYQLDAVTRCPDCGGSDFAYSGFGTQRIEAALAEHLPAARVLRMDLDSTRRRGAQVTMIEAFEEGEADILLGTQMVAKGFDFPRVTLVGVLQADRAMSLPDFRAQERAFQLLTQVAGRAGRGARPGEVVFQTYLPTHHVITAAYDQDYESFYRREIAERGALRYPPLRRMANLLFDGPDETAVIRRANAVADELAARRGLDLLGPAPMPLSRLKGQFRWHLTLISGHPGVLTRILHEVLDADRARRPHGRVRIQVDMDPASML